MPHATAARFSRTFTTGSIGVLLACAFTASVVLVAQRATRPSAGVITLDAGTTIVIGADEPPALMEAARDLASDFEKVLGRRPRIVSRREDAGRATVVIGYRSAIVQGLRPAAAATNPESFSIAVKRTAWTEAPDVVLLAGADLRGTMYAVYQFAEQYLGIDPLYYWTDHVPARKTRVEIPAALSQSFSAPVFKYRGFFVNDEDLLTGWAPGPPGEHTGIALEVWNKIFETTLRLKGNITAPGTWIFPDEPQVRLAGRRGLIVTEHHAIPLGVNVARWPQNVPYSYNTHPEILQRAWKNAVAAYAPDQEVLWTVGLRGLSDSSYAAFDPSVGNDSHALGRLIGRAMADQVAIVRASRPDASFITNLWQEGARLVQQGDLEIPKGVSPVWADDGYGNLQDGGRVAAGHGAYYHVAMMNGRANQLTEMVPVERIFSELGRYVRAGATEYLLVNTSDIRPVSMTIKAVMETGWKGVADPAADFYRRWSSDQFGSGAAADIAAVYADYFTAPARTTNDGATREYGDQLYHTVARRMMLTALVDGPMYTIASQAPPWVPPRRVDVAPGGAPLSRRNWLRDTTTAEIAACSDAERRWDGVWEKARAAEALVVPERLPFFRAHVMTMIAINRNSNRMLLEVARAIQAAAAGHAAQARDLLAQGLQAIDEIRRAETAAEYGQWKNWYAGDWLTSVSRTREAIQLFAQHLDDPRAPLPSPMLWDWEAYYHIMHYEGDRAVDVK